MKKFLSLAIIASVALTSLTACAQQEDKSKRPSPPDSVMQTVNGKMIMVNYSQPALKGRTMGVSVEPMKGKVWRAGANEATIFEIDKDVTVEGKPLPAGKYALFMLVNPDNSWTIIFNKDWSMWGTQYEQNKAQDVLHVTVQPGTSDKFMERLTYTISDDGVVSLLWGNTKTSFHVK